MLARCRDVLFQARSKRVRPGWDDKVLADWNGLAIAGLARAASVFGKPAWLARAIDAYCFIMEQMAAPHGGVQHAWRLGRVTAPGMLDDQAAMARAALALFEATGEAGFLDDARRIAAAAETAFTDGHGGFFVTSADATDVPMSRPRTAADNATPAGAGVMAEVLARLYHLTGDAAWRQRATAVLGAFGGAADQLSGMPTLLAAADLLEEAATVVIAGDTGQERARTLAGVALSAPDPAVAVLRVADASLLPADHPAYGKAAGADGPVAYVCQGSVCGLPMADASMLASRLRKRR